MLVVLEVEDAGHRESPTHRAGEQHPDPCGDQAEVTDQQRVIAHSRRQRRVEDVGDELAVSLSRSAFWSNG